MSKAIDKAAGAAREVVGTDLRYVGMSDKAKRAQGAITHDYSAGWVGDPSQITAPATPEAARWQGWGTALKPGWEIIVVARKPLIGTVAANVLQYGTGALNIDATRIGDGLESQGERATTEPSSARRYTDNGAVNLAATPGPRGGSPAGRWPANVVLDEHAAAELDQQSGELKSPASYERNSVGFNNETAYGKFDDQRAVVHSYGDSGGASRFFFVARKDESCGDCSSDTHTTGDASATAVPDGGLSSVAPVEIETLHSRFIYTAKASTDERIHHDGISHPTVKPLSLMRWLARLVTQPGGVVLDPFAGSGTTVEACILEGFRCIAIEREAPYLPLITQRINRRLDPVAYLEASGDDLGLFGDIA